MRGAGAAGRRTRRALGRPAPALALTLALTLAAVGSVACSSRPAPRFTPAALPPESPESPESPEAPKAPKLPDASEAPVRGRESATPRVPPVAPPTSETIPIAPGVQVVLERPASAGAETTGVIDAFRDYFTGSLKAVVTGGRDTSYLETVQEPASRDAYLWVRRFLDERRTVRGTARLYALNVVSVTGPGAQVNACVDESGMRLADSGTGEALREQPRWTREPFLQVAGVRRGDDGIWRVKLLRHAELPAEPAKGCLR